MDQSRVLRTSTQITVVGRTELSRGKDLETSFDCAAERRRDEMRYLGWGVGKIFAEGGALIAAARCEGRVDDDMADVVEALGVTDEVDRGLGHDGLLGCCRDGKSIAGLK